MVGQIARGLAPAVLARGLAPYRLVDLRGAITGIDVDRFANHPADALKPLSCEPQRLDDLRRGRVVQATTRGGFGEGKFFKKKMHR